jgi:transposase
MDKYIGFDIDCKKTVCCVVQAGKKDFYSTISSDIGSMRKFLSQQSSDNSKTHLAFEISGQAGFIYDSLIDYASTIKVANPSKMTWIYRTSKKNDKIDARKMAVLLSIGELPEVYMPSKAIRQWRETILHRKKMVCKATQVKNRIRATFKAKGYSKAYDKGSWWKKSNRTWMKEVCQESINTSELWHIHADNLIEELELLENQIKKITSYLDEYLDKKPGCKLLMSIPGIGPRTAESILAYTDDIGRFSNYKQYCSYFGLTPKLDESGQNRRLGHISKHGPSVVRGFLCESSWQAIRKSKGLKAFYDRVMHGQASRKKIAIVAVCRKLLCIIRAMLGSGELFNEELVNNVCGVVCSV